MVSRSSADSNADLSRRPPLASARTLPNSRVHNVQILLVSLQSVVRSTNASALTLAIQYTLSNSLPLIRAHFPFPFLLTPSQSPSTESIISQTFAHCSTAHCLLPTAHFSSDLVCVQVIHTPLPH